MDTLIVYDSFFGNTEIIARAVAEAIGAGAQAVKVSEVQSDHLKGIKLLIVGSPTRAFRASEGTQKFLKGLPANSLNGVRVAAFDTRISAEDTKSGFLRVMIKLFGYAAKPIAKALTTAGGSLTGAPEGFIVKESEGPLKEGETGRAAAWAKSLL